MKIGSFENKNVSPAVADRKAAPSAAATAQTAEPSAQVALSASVTQLATGGADAVFDTEKVQRISDAIRDGKFQVNPGAIADKLIANAQELLADRSKP